MITQSPVLSIVMPVYNRENYIRDAVESILNQTFHDFEFIIINDGSEDNTCAIIESYPDERIKLYHNDRNRGIVYSRNHGLQRASGKYVGMFDSDDIALPDKFERQIQFLESHPDTAMVGAWVKWIDDEGKPTGKGWKLTAKPEEIPSLMVFRNYFVQSTVVIRREAIPEGGYSEGFDIVEDSKMWFDVARKHKVANIQDYLLLYRMHDGNISDMSDTHRKHSLKLIAYILQTIDIQASEEELERHLALKNSEKVRTLQDLIANEKWLLKLRAANEKTGTFDRKIFRKTVFNRWLKVLYKSRSLPLHAFLRFVLSPLTRLIF